MKFGKVNNPGELDLSLPSDHPQTIVTLNKHLESDKELQISVGCAKWNKTDLKNFYPRGTKDELAYYSTQFNSIELNAFFYRIFPPEQVEKWNKKSTNGFKFYPKVPQLISQFRRLKNCEQELEDYIHSVSTFGEKLGSCFLQMHPNYTPKSWDDFVVFIENWPKEIPLAVEFRDVRWYDGKVAEELYHLLEENNIATIITDTAGRRDLMHMRLTNPTCFIRYTGANHESDYTRLDDWVERLNDWKEQGIKEINFFVHQNMEKESPLLATYFIKKLNKKLGTDLKLPSGLSDSQGSLEI